MSSRGSGRVVVGVSDSLAGLRALRAGVAEARRRGVELHAVRVWELGQQTGIGVAYLDDSRTRLAAETVARAFNWAMGGEPTDVTVVTALLEGDPASALAVYADRDDDLLVLGHARRGPLRRLFGRSVAPACLARVSCPVLVVPSTPLARDQRRMARAIRRDAAAMARRAKAAAG